MPLVEELWNNATSPYKNWHKQIKWFSIFIKPNKCQKNRKETEMEKTYLCIPVAQLLCWPGTAQPSSWPSPPGPPSSVVFLPDRRTGACPTRARSAAPRHLPLCLPALSPPRLDAPETPRSHPDLSRTLPRPPPLPLLSPSHTRAPSPPPLAVAAATGLPSPSARA